MIGWMLRRQSAKDQLVISWSGQTLAYVLARSNADGGFEVLQSGVEHQEQGEASDDRLAHLTQRLKALGLGGCPVSVMLRPEQYQLLRIRAPAVAPDELRAAARYQILKMIDTHVDDVMVDVLRVGDGRARSTGHPAGHLFVVAARQAVIRGVLDLCDAMRWRVSVIDIQETAQRNLQTALAPRGASPARASAALVLLDPFQAMLTIVANGELFYTRRFVLPERFLESAWAGSASDPARPSQDTTDTGLLGLADEQAGAYRFLQEVQRSLDHWDRLWSSLPLEGILLYAGDRSEALSGWLTQQLGHVVQPMALTAHFAGFDSRPVMQEAACIPLLGLLLRTQQPAP